MEAGAFHGRLSDVRWDHVAVSAELPPADGAGPHAEGLTSGSVAHVSGPMLAGAARLGFHPAETHTHPARPCWPGAGVLETAGELRIEGEAGKSRESFGAALVARIAAQQGEEEERKEKSKKKKKKRGKKEKETVDEQLVRLKLQLQQRFSRGVGSSHCPPGEEGSRISSGNASSPSARGDGHGRGCWGNRSFSNTAVLDASRLTAYLQQSSNPEVGKDGLGISGNA